MILIEIIFYCTSAILLSISLVRCIIITSKDSRKSKNDNKTGFTIIICSHNELNNLQKNLTSILEQEYSKFEIIVVLDRCTDDSFDYLESVYHKNSKLRVLSINKVPDGFHPKKYGLTKAISLATHDWILLTDADCKPISKNWIETFNGKVSSDTEVIIGISPYQNHGSLLSHLISYETFQTAESYISAARRKNAYMAVGRNLAYNKKIFFDHDGFGKYQSITGGDDDLFIQQVSTSSNTEVNIDIDSPTISVPKRSWKAYLHQKTRHLSVGKYYKLSSKLKLTFQAIAHSLMWLSFIILISFMSDSWTVGLIFATVLIVRGLISNYTSSNLQIRWNPWLFPVMDFVYAILLPLISVRSFLIKRVRWN
ncbi:MAG: glycosyltransferase [Cyclobacteriaceae bacterium]